MFINYKSIFKEKKTKETKQTSKQKTKRKKSFVCKYLILLFFFKQKKCQSFKSYLLEINSEAEQNYLKDKGTVYTCILFIFEQYIVNLKQ